MLRYQAVVRQQQWLAYEISPVSGSAPAEVETEPVWRRIGGELTSLLFFDSKHGDIKSTLRPACFTPWVRQSACTDFISKVRELCLQWLNILNGNRVIDMNTGSTRNDVDGESADSLRADLANPDIGTSLLGFKQRGAAAAARTLQDKIWQDLPVSVLDYIPFDEHIAILAGTSTYDCSPGFQSALSDLQARPSGGRLFIPNGRYNLNSQLNFTGNSIEISGETEEGVVILSRSAGHTFNFILNGPIAGTPSSKAFDSCTIRNIFFYAAANSTGAAINVEYMQENGGQCPMLVENIRIANDLENSLAFKYGIRTAKAGDMLVCKVFIGFFGNQSTACIRMEHANNGPTYNLRFEHLDLNGAVYGIWGTGWMESVFVGAGSLIVGSDECLVFESAGAPYGNPHLYITGVHLNGKKNTIRTDGWRTIYVVGCDIYSGVGFGDLDGRLALFNNADWVCITGNKFEQGALSVKKEGLGLNDVRGYCVTGNNFYNINGTPVAAFGATTDRGTITGNNIWTDSSVASSGVYLQGNGNHCTISGNTIRGYATSINVAASGAPTLVTGNILRDANTGVSGRADTDARSNQILGISTPFNQVGRREFFATVVVNPPSIAAGARATILLNIRGVVLGDFVAFSAPYDISDLTITANVQANSLVALYIKNDTGGAKDLP
ncbi:hypothetical protein [Xanthomonas phaseoli]|nr:hypothetical protein [Xanthomonas phaseoli]MBO9835393.1 hypothetical protein [Xanthomonas phaseoli pv. dieffenbachiae]MBO9863359.1 hypothetical protein [Xanthomonas phaseoli pv. dieffenbachiae]MBO9867396.1 hypothetical protein [Xanthomonas phaseoli pv. dieffenbachiae]MBO9902890.1 hypothetical protein [Xanthomonas phaseoli pv. dieffenbachiae]